MGGGTFVKKVFYNIDASEARPDILRGGHRNPYQLGNAIKSKWQLFADITWAK